MMFLRTSLGVMALFFVSVAYSETQIMKSVELCFENAHDDESRVVDHDARVNFTERDHYAMIYDEHKRLVGTHYLKGSNRYNVPFAQKLSVMVAADEEYRQANPDWRELTNKIVERADEPFKTEFGLDFDVVAYVEWRSNGSKSGEILDDLAEEFSDESYDFVIGFTDDNDFTHGGIADRYDDPPNGPGFSVVSNKNPVSNAARIVQHELSHNFGLGHDSGSTKCVMNTKYELTNWHRAHFDELEENIWWFVGSTRNNRQQRGQNLTWLDESLITVTAPSYAGKRVRTSPWVPMP